MGKTWYGGVIPTVVGSKIGGLLSRPVWGKKMRFFFQNNQSKK
jgi:hypothetical protein